MTVWCLSGGSVAVSVVTDPLIPQLTSATALSQVAAAPERCAGPEGGRRGAGGLHDLQVPLQQAYAAAHQMGTTEGKGKGAHAGKARKPETKSHPERGLMFWMPERQESDDSQAGASELSPLEAIELSKRVCIRKGRDGPEAGMQSQQVCSQCGRW